MQILEKSLPIKELKKLALNTFGDFIKAVVDIENNLIALDAELHSDLEAFLLEKGSTQANLWGINLYPELENNDFVEFDSMINIRPSKNNKSRSVENQAFREKILEIVNQWIIR